MKIFTFIGGFNMMMFFITIVVIFNIVVYIIADHRFVNMCAFTQEKADVTLTRNTSIGWLVLGLFILMMSTLQDQSPEGTPWYIDNSIGTNIFVVLFMILSAKQTIRLISLYKKSFSQ